MDSEAVLAISNFAYTELFLSPGALEALPDDKQVHHSDANKFKVYRMTLDEWNHLIMSKGELKLTLLNWDERRRTEENFKAKFALLLIDNDEYADTPLSILGDPAEFNLEVKTKAYVAHQGEWAAAYYNEPIKDNPPSGPPTIAANNTGSIP